MGVLWTGVQTCAFRIWDKAAGFDVYWTHGKVDDAVRVAIARLARAEPGDVALIGNASDGIAKVASGFDWRAGDNVVAPELDYASGRFALASLNQPGVAPPLVPAHGRGLDVPAPPPPSHPPPGLAHVIHVNAPP